MIPGMQDFEKLGVFYLGKAFDLATEAAQGRPRPLRLARSRHARRLRRHDRQRQDGPLPVAARRGRDRRHPGDRSSTPRATSATCCSRFPTSRPGTSAPGSTRTTPGARASSPDDFAKQQAETWKKGLAEWGEDGARIQRLRDAADFAIYTPGTYGGPAGLDPEVVRRAGAGRPGGRGDPARAGRARRRPACWRCSASTPTRSRAASTFSSRRSWPAAWAEGRGPGPRGADRPHPESRRSRGSA